MDWGKMHKMAAYYASVTSWVQRQPTPSVMPQQASALVRSTYKVACVMECVPGSYGFSAEKQDGCTPCDCYLGATFPGSVCDATSGQCQCIPSDGDPRETDKQCVGIQQFNSRYDPLKLHGLEPGARYYIQCCVLQNAYLLSFIPTYGPLSGGTKVHMTGGYLGNSSMAFVTFGDIECTTDGDKRYSVQGFSN